MLESIEELNELIQDPKLTLVPSVLDSIEELDNIMEKGFDPVAVSVEENQTEDQEIFFKKDRPEVSRVEVLDEDTMPEFESNRVHPNPQIDKVAVDTNKKDIVDTKNRHESQVVKIVGSEGSQPGSVTMEDDYDQDDDYFYEEDEEDYDEEITKLQNQIDSIITSKSAEEGSGSSIVQEEVISSGNKKRAREDPEGSGQSQKKPRYEEIPCHLCEKSLKGVNDFLQHLSRSHHGKDLFSQFPLNEGETCQLCVEEKKEKVFVFKKNQRSNYTLHLGKNHFRVLLFVPEELRENLVQQLLETKVKPGELSFLTSDGGQLLLSLAETSAAPLSEEEEEEEGLDTTAEEIQLEGEARTGEPPALELEESCSKEAEGESKAKAKKRKSVGGCRCTLCTDESEYPRWKLMTHLVKHFDKELSKAYFDEKGLVANAPCPVCVEENKSSPFVFTSRTHYIRHVGSAHGKVVDFLPEHHTQMVRFLRGDREGSEQVENCGEKTKESFVEKKVPKEVVSNASITEGKESQLKERKRRKKSIDQESTKPRKTKKEKNETTEKLKPVPQSQNNKSFIPVLKKGNTDPKPKSKPSSSKEPSILQCGECPAALKTKPELIKHMKGHLSK